MKADWLDWLALGFTAGVAFCIFLEWKWGFISQTLEDLEGEDHDEF